MLLEIADDLAETKKIPGRRLKELGLTEKDLQNVLLKTLDRLIGEDEFLPIAQSRAWREEPDLMALDREGHLYIFELKRWESESENLLQVLKYGQIFGMHDYEALEKIFNDQRDPDSSASLKIMHHEKFGNDLEKEKFNKKQVFVTITNGLDRDTREAIAYWRQVHKLDIRPWVYRAYEFEGRKLLEITPFRTADDPLEDQLESTLESYLIVNTNINSDPACHDSMLAEKKAAAYSEPWKYKIKRLKGKDRVFLYQSGKGIVACGIADGKLQMSDDEYEYFMKLDKFHELKNPISASEIKDITGRDLVFRQTLFSIDEEAGEKLYDESRKR